MIWTHDLVRGLVKHFLSVFDYQGVPIRVTTRAENLIRSDSKRRKRYFKASDLPMLHECLGYIIPYPKHRAIFINTARHSTYHQLVDTCAHEALHASGRLRHTKKFQPIVYAAAKEFFDKDA